MQTVNLNKTKLKQIHKFNWNLYVIMCHQNKVFSNYLNKNVCKSVKSPANSILLLGMWKYNDNK